MTPSTPSWRTTLEPWGIFSIAAFAQHQHTFSLLMIYLSSDVFCSDCELREWDLGQDDCSNLGLVEQTALAHTYAFEACALAFPFPRPPLPSFAFRRSSAAGTRLGNMSPRQPSCCWAPMASARLKTCTRTSPQRPASRVGR